MLNPDYFFPFVWVWIGLAVVTFLFLFKTIAPFGRHSNEKMGPMIPNRFGWIFMESPSIWWFGLFFFMGANEKSTITWILFSVWMIHYLHRTLVFPFRTKTRGKKMPLLIAVSAFFFQLINGFIVGYSIGSFETYLNDWILDPRFISGISIFFIGLVVNHWSDAKLIALRKPGETNYKIPRGGLFKYISCPNFFGEILEWTGFALMCWSLAAFSFALWTAANLVPRAWAHHKWYKENFPDYPKERRAVIPGLF